MEFASVASQICYYNDWIGSSSTHYQHNLTINNAALIYSGSVSFMAYDPTIITFLSFGYLVTPSKIVGYLAPNLNTGATGYREDNRPVTFANNRSFNLSHTNALLVFMNGFSITANGQMNLAIFATLINSTDYSLTFATDGSTQVRAAQYHRLFFDITLVEESQIQFFDVGLVTGASSSQSTWPTIVNFQSTNFVLGVTNFSVTPNPRMNLGMQDVSPFNILHVGGYNSAKFCYWNFRVRQCLTPNIYYRLADQMCYATCPAYTYVNTTYNFCYGCNYACYSCTDPGASSCLSCDSPNTYRNLTSGSCVCDPGFYDTGVAVCAACHYSCSSCTNGTTSCLTCSGNRVMVSGMCQCPGGTYDGGVAVCLVCDYTCANCTVTATTCTACPATRTLYASSCPCLTGMYDVGVQSCASCDYSCLTCSITATNCTTCPTTRSLVSNSCPCSTSYYEVGVTACTACDVTCATCNSTDCQVCVSVNMSPVGNRCLCDSGYFNNTPTTCSLCSSLCLTCDISSTTCTSCDSALLLTLSGNTCVCSTGSFFNGTTCQFCNSTLTYCLQCTSASTCTSCSAGQVISGVCGCPAGQYLDGTVCSSCSVLFLGCTSCNSTDCTACDSALGWVLTSPTVCSCMVGYTFVAGNATCTSCGLLMNGCTSCSSTSSCQVCQSPQWTLVSGVCDCSVGYYMSGSSCLSCDPTCLTCNGPSSTNCTSCNISTFVLNGSSCVCPTGKYFVAPASCLSCDISCETCSGNLATNCLTCPTLLTLTGSQCLCPISNQFYNGSSCQPCDNTCSTCSGPLSSDCLTCTASAVLTAGTCQCPAGMFMNGTFFCQTCDLNCATCVSQTTQCTGCNSPLVLTGSVCTCSSGKYLVLTGTVYTCPSCHVSCTNCSGPLAIDCLSCLPLMVLQGSSCACPQGYFFDTTTIACQACDGTCVNCTGPSATECTTCNNATQFRVLNGTSCSCNNFTTDVGTPICQWVGCPPGSNQVGNDCVPICGDAMVLLSEQCDDGNTNSGDGCASDCTTEQNYTCSVPTGQSASICSYNQPLSVNLTKSQKLLTSNTVVFTFDIGPVIPALGSVDFSQLFSTNLTGVSLSFSYDGNGELVVQATYDSTIQGENMQITFNPLASNSPYFLYTPLSQVEFLVDPTNNQPAVCYDESVYSQVKILEYLSLGVMALALAGFAAGLVTSKFIGVELVGVVQVAYIGLMAINYLQPMLAALTKIGFINGVNTMFQDNQPLSASEPNRIQALNYTPEMIVSMNYMTALLLLPPLTALCTFVASKVAKSKEERLRLISWNIMCEYGFTFVMFCLYHMVVSLVVYAMYAGDFGQQKMLPFNLAQCVVTFGLAIALSVLYKFKPEHFGDYKRGFRADDPLSQLYYYLIIGGRVAVCTILVAANSIDYVGFITLVVPITSIIVLAVKKPYAQPYNTYRAIGNEVVVAVVLGTYGYYRAMVPYTEHTSGVNNVLPYVVIVLLLLCVLANIAIMAKYKYDVCKSPKTQPDSKTSSKAQQVKQQLTNGYSIEQQPNKFLSFDVKSRVQKIQAMKKSLFNRPLITEKEFVPEKMAIETRIPEEQLTVEAPLSTKKEIIHQLLNKNKKIVFQEDNYTQNEVNEIQNHFDAL